MDQVRALPSTALPDIIQPTWSIYAPHLAANAATITAVPKHTYPYSPTPRHQLDVYTPASPPSPSQRHTVLIYVYGGGFVQGARTLPFPPLQSLVHANIGAFFTTHYNFSVVVPDYRLVGGDHGPVEFPAGGADVAAALEWVAQHAAEVGSPSPDFDIYVVGQSAGGVHVSTMALHPQFAPLRRSLRPGTPGPAVQGVVLVSTPYEFEALAAAGPLAAAKKAYYGDDEAKHCPRGLLEAHDGGADDWVRGETSFVAIRFERDTEALFRVPWVRFGEVWREKVGEKRLEMWDLEGHNHISPTVSLGSGLVPDEEWGRKLGDWIRARGAGR